eukprot:84291-Rhodomonas_salina.1
MAYNIQNRVAYGQCLCQYQTVHRHRLWQYRTALPPTPVPTAHSRRVGRYGLTHQWARLPRYPSVRPPRRCRLSARPPCSRIPAPSPR